MSEIVGRKVGRRYAVTNIRPEPELLLENTLNAMLLYLNYTLAASKLKISAKTLRRRMRRYGWTIDKLKEEKANRARQSRIRFVSAK